MKTIITSIFLLVAAQAQADGFVCQAQSAADLNVKVYNHTQPEQGTRNAAVMVLSNSNMQEGRKTIARFQELNSTLTNQGATYVADVDLRYADSRKKGKLILGTKLGYVDQVILDIDFSYDAPISKGESAQGLLTLVKRNGERTQAEMDCVRYLKNE